MTDRLETMVRVPVMEKIGLGATLFIAIIVIGFSLFSFIINLIFEFNLFGIMIDLIFLGIGVLLGYFAIHIYKKSVYYENLMDTAFDRGIYTRLEPVLRKVVETQVEMESVGSRLNKIDHMVQTVIDEQVKMEKSPQEEVKKSVVPGTSMSFVTKVILLTVVSMSGFIFMIETSFGMAHLATVVFFVLWWILITWEYRVFDKNTAWIVLFLPIILVPFSFMFLGIVGIFGMNNLLGIFYTCLAIYAFLYYSWAVYETKGTLPFSLIRG